MSTSTPNSSSTPCASWPTSAPGTRPRRSPACSGGPSTSRSRTRTRCRSPRPSRPPAPPSSEVTGIVLGVVGDMNGDRAAARAAGRRRRDVPAARRRARRRVRRSPPSARSATSSAPRTSTRSPAMTGIDDRADPAGDRDGHARRARRVRAGRPRPTRGDVALLLDSDLRRRGRGLLDLLLPRSRPGRRPRAAHPSRSELMTASETMVRMGELAVSSAPGHVLVSLGLGSCIGLGLIDRRMGIAGLAHVVLPAVAGPRERERRASSPTVAIPELLGELEQARCAQGPPRGCARRRREHVRRLGFESRGRQRNEAAVRELLEQHRIPVLARRDRRQPRPHDPRRGRHVAGDRPRGGRQGHASCSPRSRTLEMAA